MANQIMRIIIKGYDHTLVDEAAAKLVDSVKRSGDLVAGPIPLPTKKEVVTILRSVHKDKDSREQFEQRTHKRLIDIENASEKTMNTLKNLEMPAGIFVDIKIKK